LLLIISTGNHPIYFDHRGKDGTHGVFLLNSNGMDVYVDDDDGSYLEYNTLGGVFEFYFLAGPTPTDVSKQYADVVGHPASMPYWGFGLHQCRYGYEDWFEVAEVVHNYSQANIPLETMWTDIDYMDGRKVFTLDPERYLLIFLSMAGTLSDIIRFPLEKMRELVTSLHDHQQHYVVMVDPAVGYSDYPAFNNGVEKDVFLKRDNGSIYKGVVWPGVTAFPDWFHPNVTDYWNSEFQEFFSADTGVDIDALWIDMNEASNFCIYPCSNPEQIAKEYDLPPAPPAIRDVPLRPLPGFPSDFQPPSEEAIKPRKHETIMSSPVRARGVTERVLEKRNPGDMKGLLDRNLIEPKFEIHNAAGGLSNKTLDTDLIHANGLAEYDTHNMYGTMMSSASRTAMISRRPGIKPLIITRSTFAGAGSHVGHWLGDNVSTWYYYLISIRQMIAFASLFQLPMVGSDVCGFNGNTTEHLCARWTTLGAFNPFFRNHNGLGSSDQEFYRWELVAQAARSAIDRRYKMLDYIYTALQKQSVDGTPLLSPLFFMYPSDTATFGIDTQFFYGPSVLVSPVTAQDSTSVDIYLPDDLFYDYYTGVAVQGHGATLSLSDIAYDAIPLHIRAGSITPLRIESANTTTELRKKNFNILVALDSDHKAEGSLYLDDGVSLLQKATSDITFTYGGGPFAMDGTFGYDAGVKLETVTFWGLGGEPKRVVSGGKDLEWEWHAGNGTLVVQAEVGLDKAWSMMVT
jgi:alpha-glucosidase